MYKLRIHKQARKKLQTFNAKDRLKITDRIVELSLDPDSTKLDIKKMRGQDLWRLRVGSWRIIYDRDDVVKIISIEKIKPRGDVYK
jgi:mRNA interferase RelE/StbE